MQTHRQIAKRKTILWQGAAIVILAAAGAAIALPSVGNLFAVAEKKNRLTIPPLGPPKHLGYDRWDFQVVSAGARDAGVQVVTVVHTPENPDPTGPITEDAPPPPVSTDWSYVGSIITPASSYAYIGLDGRTQLFALGAAHNDTTLTAITPDHITVQTAGVSRDIARAERKRVTPDEPPKRGPAPRPATAMIMPGGIGAPGMGQPGAIPMGINARAMNPNVEQARAAAMAAAEAARRSEAANRIDIVPFEKLNAEEVQMAAKHLSDPSLDDGARAKYLSLLGINPGTPVDQALVRAKEAGLDLGSDAGRPLLNTLETNAKKGR